MASNRIARINEEIQRQISADIRRLKDPRVSGSGMVSVTRVDTTGDLRYAKIYVSVLEEDKREPMMKALKSASGFIRRELGKRMLIRYSPEMTFVSDENIAYGVHIAEVLRKAQESEESTHGEGEATDE